MIAEDRWYVGQTRAGLGPWAEKNLQAQGIQTYAPRIARPDGDGSEALFPRYVFVKVQPVPKLFAKINSTRGMQKLLPLLCETPLHIRTDYMDDLMYRVGLMATLDVAEEVTYDYARCDRLEVTCGEWAGRRGEYQYRKKNLAVVLIAMMGREVTVHVPLHHTRPAEDRLPRISVAPLVSEFQSC